MCSSPMAIRSSAGDGRPPGIELQGVRHAQPTSAGTASAIGFPKRYLDGGSLGDCAGAEDDNKQTRPRAQAPAGCVKIHAVKRID
jgi:hypothetical protein